jgi:YHS domain-containing protein
MAVFAAVTVAVAGAAGAARAATPDVSIPERSRVCMMQDTVMATPAIPLSHGGRTYYGCCEMCKAKIAAEPARYTVARDPVSGAAVDKATAELLSVDGRVFYFESGATRGTFRSRLAAPN